MEFLGFILGVIFFVALEGFFAGSEIALLNVDKGVLTAIARRKGYRFVEHFLKSPEEYITLTMLGYTVSVVFAATFYTLALISIGRYFPPISGYEVLLSQSLVLLTITFGEIVPKSLFQHYADRLSIPSIFILDKLKVPLTPLLRLSTIVSRSISGRFARRGVVFRREDIIELLREKKTFGEYAGLVVSNVLSFRDRRVGEIVKPIYEIVMISENASVSQAIEKIKESGYSRIPVYRVRVDDVVGYVSAYDLLKAQPQEPIKRYVRDILVFSEYTPLPTVVDELREKKEHIAVVVDERGVIIGIVTLEDVFREILGSVHADRGGEELIKEISKDKWIADGKLELNELVRITGVKLPEGNYSTVGGFLSYLAGRIPREGESFEVGGFLFKVVSRDERRVGKVLIEKVRRKDEVQV